jgi:hypothetical protein
MKFTFHNDQPNEFLQILREVAQWQPDIEHAHLNGALTPSTSFDWKLDGLGLHSTLHTVVPATELGWTGTFPGLYVVHNYILVPAPGGTRVTVDETMQGWLAWLLQAVLKPKLTEINRQWLERLKAEAEK